jgi:RNA polymerase sigma-70 factor (ECF subfamily)
MDQEELALIERCKRGEHDAFDRLVSSYEKRIFSFAYRLCGHYDDANDICAEAFIRVFQSIHRFRGAANFSTWVFRITTNVYLDRRKRTRNRRHMSLDECMDMEDSGLIRQIEDPSPTPHRVAEQNEQSDILRRAVASLPKSQRAIIALYHVEDLSYREIAETMALPLGTVKSRLNRTRQNLRSRLLPMKELLVVG